jgi:small subunit ribosomal protein S9
MSKPLTQTTGRRKRAVARVRVRPGTGVITVNKREVADYFPSETHRMILTEPLRITGTAEVYDIDATLDGGGPSGQAGALRHGISRALIELDPELRPDLKKAGFLTRDRGEGAEVRPRRPARRLSTQAIVGGHVLRWVMASASGRG